MYIHIGQNTVIDTENIIGIFDLDTTTVSKITRDWLSLKENENKVNTVSLDLPKSFVLYNDNNKDRIFICQYSPMIITKRINEQNNI